MAGRKVALVTGAAKGIGAALAAAFADAGYRVVIHYLTSEAQARAVHEQVTARHGADAALVAQADVSDRAGVLPRTSPLLILSHTLAAPSGYNSLVNSASGHPPGGDGGGRWRRISSPATW